MESMPDLPGTHQHQALLRALIDHYASDGRMRALIVFGSLGRGDWDEYSDLDLDVILADGVTVNPVEEMEALRDDFEQAGERIAFIIPDGDEECDLQFESLMQISVRFHPLATTKPAILDTMRILCGSLDPEAIRAAGEANRTDPVSIAHLLNSCVRYAVVAHIALQRGQPWAADEILHRMRALLMELYTRARGGERTYKFFDEQASEADKARLRAAHPACDLKAQSAALGRLIDLMESGMAEWSLGQARLGERQLLVVRRCGPR